MDGTLIGAERRGKETARDGSTIETVRVDFVAADERVTRPGTDQTVPVEFAGWLPVFGNFGNCGAHPQFSHTESAPDGYRFVRSVPADSRPSPRAFALLQRFKANVGWLTFVLYAPMRPFVSAVRNGSRYGWGRVFRLVFTIAWLCLRLLCRGARPWPLIRFLRSRHFPSQIMLPRSNRLVFLTSIPYTFGQDPWVIEIEDSTTLFYPFVHNGQTHSLPIQQSPFFPLVRALLESSSCRGIITHMRSTADSLPVLFRSEKIARKTFHVPLGVKVPRQWQRHEGDGPINLLFTCSWHQHPDSFFLRGGLEVLEAFSLVRERFPNLRLTLRTGLPRLEACHHRMIEQGWVRVIDRFLSHEEMEDLLHETHVFLLPSARIHVVSLLRAMSYGHVVIASDGWGFDEYVRHGENGVLVKGRRGTASWMDEESGLLREDYRPMFRADPLVVEGLVRELTRVVEDGELRRRLGGTARRDVETRYNLEQWNRGLKAVFDHALSR